MTRPLRAAVVCAVLALAAAPVVGTFAQSSGSVVADKEGWWNRTRGAAGGTPVGGGNEPKLPETVPADAIGIAATAGEAQKIAALGIVLDAPRGSAVSRFTLTMKEAEGTGAQQNSGDALIAACPVVGFFAGAENGAFQDVPEADCEAARVEGARAEDGTWTFDLLPIADLWLDPFGTINPDGIRFDPAGTGTFQVSLTGMEDASFDVSITPAEEDADPFDSSTTTVAGGFTGSSSSSGGGDFATSPPPAVDVPADGEAATTTPTTTATPVAGDDDETATDAPRESRAGDVSGNLPGGVLLVLLVAIGLVLLLAWHLGPAGRRPHDKIQRSGGVSRALAARSSTTGASS
jgi:hypothetical protein